MRELAERQHEPPRNGEGLDADFARIEIPLLDGSMIDDQVEAFGGTLSGKHLSGPGDSAAEVCRDLVVATDHDLDGLGQSQFLRQFAPQATEYGPCGNDGREFFHGDIKQTEEIVRPVCGTDVKEHRARSHGRIYGALSGEQILYVIFEQEHVFRPLHHIRPIFAQPEIAAKRKHLVVG